MTSADTRRWATVAAAAATAVLMTGCMGTGDQLTVVGFAVPAEANSCLLYTSDAADE